ncbi:MAG: transcriptional regulator [Pyrinomonadaceae bacterium]
MPFDARPQFAAFQALCVLQRKIASESYPSLQTLAEELELSKRTIQRHLDRLKEFGAPLIYDKRKKGYCFTDKFWQLPTQKLTEGDMLAFFIAEQSLRFIGQHEYASKLRISLGKFASMLPEHVSINLSTLASGSSFQSTPYATVDPALLEKVAKSCISQEKIEFDYFSPHKREHSRRSADVHALHNFAGDWYAISFDTKAKGFRDFHVGRMSNFSCTGRYFERQPNWNSDDYIRSGFNMMKGGKPTYVVLEFDAYQAQWIRERTSFHSDEVREELANGELRLCFSVGEEGLEAVARFCLTYADHCRVVKPKKLISMVKKKLEKALEILK